MGRWLHRACRARVEKSIRVVEMPTRNITNCTFGGKDLDILYVTTAASPGDKGDRLAGSLFAVKTKVRGLPENRFHHRGLDPTCFSAIDSRCLERLAYNLAERLVRDAKRRNLFGKANT